MRRLRKAGRFWNRLSIFWKSYFLFLGLSIGVISLGEGIEDLAEGFLEGVGYGQAAEFLSWLMATVTASLAASFVFSRIATFSLKRLHGMAMKLAKGDLSARLSGPTSKRGDEIGDLARAFNRMADGLTELLENERRLTRDISHELRSPLSRMMMIPAMMEKKLDMRPKESAAQYLALLEKDMDCMESMIRRMLEQARLETMLETGLEKEKVDLAAIVRESVDDLLFQAEEEGKVISLEAPENLPCLGGGLILKMAVDNPLRNALRHTAAGTRVSVRLRREGGEALAEISDQGPGLSEDLLSDIFKPFFRADSARDRQSGGFGLGLAIAERAAKAHGGRMEAANILLGGRRAGLRVTLRLPV